MNKTAIKNLILKKSVVCTCVICINILFFMCIIFFSSSGGGESGHLSKLYTYAVIADAGYDQIVNQGEQIFLDGTKSYVSDHSTLSYEWEQISGRSVDLSNRNLIKLSFVALLESNFSQNIEFRLTVKDHFGNPYSDTCRITILPKQENSISQSENNIKTNYNISHKKT